MSTKTFLMPNDLSELCRVCLQLPEESQYLDLTTIYDEEDNLSYGECFTICTQIDLSAGEGVPHHLCKSCGLELQMSYDFHKKIEESKRVIEQCQLQNEEQKANSMNLLNSSGNSNKLTLEQLEVVQIICDKFEESYHEEELPGTSQEPEEDCEMKQDNDQGFISNIEIDDEVNDEMDIINKMCNAEVNKQQQEIPPDKENASAKETNENINQDHLEMEDYQNLEALEEEETETIQINCGEKTIPVQITKYTLDSGDNVEFLEYTEYYNEESERDVHKEEEAEEEETNEENIEQHLKWQENVVTVANKEHLPIKDEYEEEQEEEEVDESVFALSEYKNNDNEITLNELSQDKTFEGEEEGEEENEDDLNTKTTKRKTNTNNNNNVSRKRHVGSYSCDFCQRVYPNYSRMKTHRRCHEEDRPKFFCSHCGRMYATKQARDCHVQTAHEKSGFTCSICNKVFAIRKSLEIHIRYHTGDFPFACKLCDKKFAQVCHLNTHTNVKHNQIRFSCDYPNCDKTFTSSSSLRNHEYTHGVMPFECEYCQQGYPAKSKLRIHIQRKHSIDMSHDQLEKMHLPPSVLLKEASPKTDFKSEQDTITNTTITPCIPTGIRLPLPSGPPFICEFCGHSSNTKNLLASHRHRKHRYKESFYQCYKCEKQFNSKDSFDKHTNRLSCQHYPEFTCEYCYKLIKGSANYKIHLRFHQKIYPYECDKCGKGFMMSIHLKTHVQTKHENKRYICEEPQCGKFFQSHQSLKSHMYVHLGSMPYCCYYCEKMFPNRGRLRWHIKTSHDFETCPEDMDCMLVSEEISIKAKVKTVDLKTKRKLVTNIQKKPINEQQQIKVKDELKTLTESPAKYTTGPITSNEDIVKIKTEIFDDHEDNNHETIIANKHIENIKIEKETISEYIVTSPNIIPASSSQLILDTHPPNAQLKTQNFFSCEFCGHKMPTRNALYKHRLRKHKDQKGFQQISSKSSKQFCYLCPKSFISKSLLKQHIDVEHFNKKFACEHCGHLLPTKNALCQHRLRKHRDIERSKTKSIQFKCPKCLDIFINAESLHLHSIRMHIKKPVIAEKATGFPCTECGHVLPTKNALSQHCLRKHRMKRKRKNSEGQES